MPYFGTTPFAAPGLGLIAAAVMLMLGLWWLHWRSAQARARNGPSRSLWNARETVSSRPACSVSA